MATLTIIILTKNHEDLIASCIASCGKIAKEVLVVDSVSTDKTVAIAQKLGARVIAKEFVDFASQRNFALAQAACEWVFYLDTDEMMTPELQQEITHVIQNPHYNTYKVLRRNYYFKKYQWPREEKMERLFKKTSFKKWVGKLHESPIVEGEIGQLIHPILHFSHRDLFSMLSKTIIWSDVEAQLRYNNNHPPMSSWRFVRVMITGFWEAYIRQGGWRVGMPGFIESVYQMYSIFVTYARLWELQQKAKASK